MANITQLTTITTVTNTTTFVVINNSSTRRVSFLTIKNQLLNETGKLSALTDVNVTGVTNGNILVYNTSTAKWIVGTTPSGTLTGLTDVNVGGVTDGQILAYDADSDQWIASSNVAATSLADLTDVTILETPLDGQVLKYNSENDKWLPGTDNAGSGIGLSSRTTAVGVTSSIYPNATENISFTGFKSYVLLKISTNVGAWVRLYTTSAARSSDSARAQTTDPTPGSGVIAEVITSGNQTVLMTPGVFGFNNDGTPSTTIYAAVTNLTLGQQAITVTLTLVQLEA
jgi:hypothetical protein